MSNESKSYDAALGCNICVWGVGNEMSDLLEGQKCTVYSRCLRLEIVALCSLVFGKEVLE